MQEFDTTHYTTSSLVQASVKTASEDSRKLRVRSTMLDWVCDSKHGIKGPAVDSEYLAACLMRTMSVSRGQNRATRRECPSRNKDVRQITQPFKSGKIETEKTLNNDKQQFQTFKKTDPPSGRCLKQLVKAHSENHHKMKARAGASEYFLATMDELEGTETTPSDRNFSLHSHRQISHQTHPPNTTRTPSSTPTSRSTLYPISQQTATPGN